MSSLYDNGKIDTDQLIEDFRSQGRCGFTIAELAEFYGESTSWARHLIRKISDRLWVDDQSNYVLDDYREGEGDYLVMAREPGETVYHCHAICETRESALRAARSLRWKAGRRVRIEAAA